MKKTWLCSLFGHKPLSKTRVDASHGPRVIAQAKENIKKIDYSDNIKHTVAQCGRCGFWIWPCHRKNKKIKWL